MNKAFLVLLLIGLFAATECNADAASYWHRIGRTWNQNSLKELDGMCFEEVTSLLDSMSE
uniref:Uncharacterized protein n=1 Tax=Ciona savignyi TaxID=51511 RepID=H2ZDC6_CIOSA